MKDIDTKSFLIGFTSSFIAGIVLIYVYSKWYQGQTMPLKLENDYRINQYQY